MLKNTQHIAINSYIKKRRFVAICTLFIGGNFDLNYQGCRKL